MHQGQVQLLAAVLGAASAAAAPAAQPARPLPSPGTPATLRGAVEHLRGEYGARYTIAADFLKRLADIERTMQSGDSAAKQAAQETFAALQHEALIAHPVLAEHPLLFVARRQYAGDHHNTETMFQTGEIASAKFAGGGALKLLDLRTGKLRTLVDLPKGVARDPDVSFDGRRVLFSMRRDAADDYHIYEVGADGKGLRQLTAGKGLSDIDPLYLATPPGRPQRIAFSSSREPKYCMCNRHIMCNLFRMELPDKDGVGTKFEQIGRNPLFEGHGVLMADGRILYDRWEYVDRNFGDAQGTWTCNPDGTNHAVYWGNNTASPGAVLDAREVPTYPLKTGRPQAFGERFVATFSSCHDRPWGAIALVDRTRGIDGRPPVVRTWPAEAIDLVEKGGYDSFTRVWPKYEDPFPLDGSFFLCSRMTGKGEPLDKARGEQMGVYLLDLFGNEVLLHAEADGQLGCFDPMPLCPRPQPPVIPDRTEPAAEGRLYVHDVYIGTGMDRVRRGAVKYLRVVESPEKRSYTPARRGTAAPASRRPAWRGTTSTTSGSSARWTCRPTDRRISRCRPTGSSTSNSSTPTE